MQRSLIALISGVIFAFQITVVILGYAHYGAYPSLGTTKRIDGFRTQIVQVSEAARAGGFRDGDIIDSSELPLSQRLAAYWSHWNAGTTFVTPVHRNGTLATADVYVTALNQTWFTFGDVASRMLFFALAILLILRGNGSAGIYGGISILSLCLTQGYSYNWGAVPIALGVAGFLIQTLAYFPSVTSRLDFAAALLPAGVRLPRSLTFTFWLLLGMFTATLLERRVEAFSGYTSPNSSLLFQLSQLLFNAYFLVVFGYVASKAANPATRVLFWSYCVGVIGVVINPIVVMFGYPPPFNGALNLMWALYAIGFAYAVFAKRLVSVNFYVSRAAVYTIVLGVIVGVFVLLEHLIEVAAIGKTPSLILELLVPLALGLSLRYIEHYAEGIVERVFYREKQTAEDSLNKLIADFPHARNVSTLERGVVDDVSRLMHADSAALYRESELGYQAVATHGGGTFPTVGEDDRAFLRMRSTLAPVDLTNLGSQLHGAIAFPLVVVGQVTGALVVGAREHDEPYDPDEIALLAKLSHELGITLLWAEREPLRIPSL